MKGLAASGWQVLLTESLPIFREIGFRGGEARAIHFLAEGLSEQGDYANAEVIYLISAHLETARQDLIGASEA